ncbi:MAG: ABC transporter permease [Candidatus Gastranaerophilales bacterium]|nr:ABC transporter permease [Candidatus Gastranaerophilales bacterium]
MENFSIYFKQSATYQLYRLFTKQVNDFFTTLGEITRKAIDTFAYILKLEIDRKAVLEQSARFGVSSLPITLSIVGMSAIIVAMQVAGEMVKQGAGNYVGQLVTILIVREDAVIMSGFAIISMIGSSLASEIATMRVTEQLDAMQALKVDPIRYLFVPRVVSGIIMMPFVVIVAAVVGVLGGALASNLAGGLNYRAFFDSVWYGLYMKDIWVCLAKAVVFGGTIAIVSCTCGYRAKGGAKGVGIATTKAVVWSFVAIAVWDLLFAAAFFF